jgi:phosphomannomutase
LSEIIASVSGIRGITGDSLTPYNIIKFTSAFAEYCRRNSRVRKLKIVLGRDGRLSGEIIEQMVFSNLAMSGAEVISIGTAPTPTVQIATEELKCSGGISITASHNPQEWNGLKFLNSDGTFLDDKQIEELLKIAEEGNFIFAELKDIKPVKSDDSWLDRHIEKVLALSILNTVKVRKRKFRVVVDAVNASGSVIVPRLLKKLGCEVIELFCNSSGKFPHTPEPIPENLMQLSAAVRKYKADIGISVDPDADRLVLITDKGEPFSEENTIVTVAEFVLKNTKSAKKGVTVNFSTTRAVEDIAKRNNAQVFRSAVGEINVVKEMQRNGSVIGGEGSGGVIFPEVHYGRDSLVGIALILNEIADSGRKVSEYKKMLPEYFISKGKVGNVKNPDSVLQAIERKFSGDENVIGVEKSDGLKLDFETYWIHLRKSNTEPIIRIITEARSKMQAEEIQKNLVNLISQMGKSPRIVK